MNLNTEKVAYKPANKNEWSGRVTPKDLGNQYWYQAIECINLEEELPNTDFALIGYACEEGVRRNQGRIGAKEGPATIRKKLASVAWHTNRTVVDVGTISCVDQNLEECQNTFSNAITSLLQEKIFPIAIGGGHDIAYAHFKGIFQAVENKVQSIGIINFDAHFDLRPPVNGPNSGTPFNQILDEMADHKVQVNYFPIGIQDQANTNQLFNIAEKYQVQWVENDACNFEEIKSKLEKFIEQNEVIYSTIDLDGFSSAYAPGVSAPSPLGFTPEFVLKCLELLMKSGKVISLDLAEMNPKYDIDNHTAILAARLIDAVVRMR